MKNFLKIFLLIFMCFSFAFCNQAFAQKWNKSFILIYVPNEEPYYGMMANAISEWGKTAGKRMIFTATSQIRDVPIAEVETVFNILSGEDAKISGVVEFNSTTHYFRQAKMTINIVEPDETLDEDAKKALNDETYTIMLKTVGKMLGMPDSADENSIMFPKYKEGQKILDSDKDNFYKVYDWAKPIAPANKR